MNWSLISFVDLAASLFIRFTAQKRSRYHGWIFLACSLGIPCPVTVHIDLERCSLLCFIFCSLSLSTSFPLTKYSMPLHDIYRGFDSDEGLYFCGSLFIFSLFVIFAQVIFLVICVLVDTEQKAADSWWMNFFGFMTVQSWKSPVIVYFLVVQVFVAVIALLEIHRDKISLFQSQDSCWGYFSSVVDNLGSHLRVASCLLLPAIQLFVGISYPSWLSLPFFICSCVGLVDWSLTSNFLGLFRWWKVLWLYAGFKLCLLYMYQLPTELPEMYHMIANYIGLHTLSATSDLQEICSTISLLVFYYVLSCVKGDLEEMDYLMSIRQGNLAEQLLPSSQPFFIRELRSGARHANVFLRRTVFRIFTINFFTYGFPVDCYL